MRLPNVQELTNVTVNVSSYRMYVQAEGLVAERSVDVNLIGMPADRAGNVLEARFHGE
jgi:hypothetical protein